MPVPIGGNYLSNTALPCTLAADALCPNPVNLSEWFSLPGGWQLWILHRVSLLKPHALHSNPCVLSKGTP